MIDVYPPLILFPSIIHGFKIKNFRENKDNFIEYIQEQRTKDFIGVSRSNEGGWQSHDEYHKKDSLLINTLTESLYEYFADTEIFERDREVKIRSMWLNINERGNFNFNHTHPGCHLSGVFWIKIAPNCGELSFDSPNQFSQWDEIKSYCEKFKEFSKCYEGYHLDAIEGFVTIFPASLYHTVHPNKSKTERISVSFNLDII